MRYSTYLTRGMGLLLSFLLMVSCVRKEDIRDLQNQINQIRGTQIAGIESQISSIKASIASLEEMDKELEGYIRTLQVQASALEKEAEALASSIASLKEELKGDITSAQSAALLALEEYKSEVEQQLSAIRSTIESLESSGLAEEIAALREYVDGEIQGIKKWTSATFATLDQFNSLSEVVSGIQPQIDAVNQALSTKVSTTELDEALDALEGSLGSEIRSAVESCNASIETAKDEITAAYTDAIAEAIAASESSMKLWVNSQLTNYYTIAQTEERISALQTLLEGELSAQKSYLEGVISELEKTLESKISANTSLIDGLREDLTAAQGEIASLGEKVASNSASISANAESIRNNAQKIAEAMSSIGTNADAIAAAEALIAENKELISSNSALISTNKTDIASLKSSLSGMEGQMTENAEKIEQNANAIADNASDIASNASLIASNAQAIASNAGAISQNAADIESLRAELASSKSELTEAYQSAIEQAISQTEGVFTGRLAEEVDALNSKIADEIAAVNNRIATLEKRVDACEQEIASIKNDLASMNDRIEDLENQISDLINSIQSITYVPKYSDGAAHVNWYYGNNGNVVSEDFDLDFKVLPSGSAYKIASVWQNTVSAEAVYTLTRSLVDAVPLTVKSVVSDGDYIRVTLSGVGLKDEFYRGECGASVSVAISNGNSNLQTEYVPLVSKKSIEINDPAHSFPGFANCYIVTESGNYSFKVVKGNSTSLIENAVQAELLWESFGTNIAPNKGDLITDVEYSDRYVTFSASNNKGNAVIAVKDETGDILWSWHIWLTDQPEDQIYHNDAGIMMDRNLGATSAKNNNIGAFGLLYQWGRKDPFLGASSTDVTSVSRSTIPWPTPIASNSSTGTIEYTISHPTTFVTFNSNNSDWYYTGDTSTDKTRWQAEKTIYDPCPPGYKIPTGGGDGIWAKALYSQAPLEEHPSDYKNGFNFGSEGDATNKLTSSSSCYYPAASEISMSSGELVIKEGYAIMYGNYWSCMINGYRPAFFTFSNMNVYPSNYLGSAAKGCSVRCMKE